MDEYNQEWERLSIVCDLNESEEMWVSKFIGGFREELRRKLELNENPTFILACSTSLTLEKYSKKKSGQSNAPSKLYKNMSSKGIII